MADVSEWIRCEDGSLLNLHTSATITVVERTNPTTREKETALWFHPALGANPSGNGVSVGGKPLTRFHIPGIAEAVLDELAEMVSFDRRGPAFQLGFAVQRAVQRTAVNLIESEA